MENISVENLGFTNRTKNALMRGKVATLEILMGLSEGDILNIRNMGTKSVQEVLDFQEMIRQRGESLTFSETPTSCIIDESNVPFVINVAHPNTMGKKIQQIQYRAKTGILMTDIAIVETGLSVRTTNALINGGYSTINEVAFTEYELIPQLKNMGAKSVAEIVEYFRLNTEVVIIGDRLSELLQEVYEYIVALNGNMEYVYSNQINEYMKILLVEKEEEINILREECGLQGLVESERFKSIILNSTDIGMVYKSFLLSKISDDSIEELKSIDNFYYRVGIFEKSIVELLEESKIENVDGKLRIRLPYISDWLLTLNENQFQAVRMRIEGKTLEECGMALNLTRERIRQIVNKAITRKPLLREDDYACWFEKYYFNRESFANIFGQPAEVYNYLNMIYKRGTEPVEQMLDDTTLSKELYAQLKQYLNRDSILIGDEYVPCKRELLWRKLAESMCSDSDMTFDDFYEYYMKLLQSEKLDNNDKLLFPSSRAFAARLEDSPYILVKYGRKFRYYPIESCDVEELVNRLHLEQFKDVEISTLKLLEECKDVMKEFNIQDEYELHNLLKKTENIWNPGNKYHVVITRMPFLSFGAADREKQTEELLFLVAPVSIEDYCAYYEMEYGVLARTVMANFTPYISKYYHNGVYTIDQPIFTEEEYIYMRDFLKKDFYFLEDIRSEYIAQFGVSTVKKVNPRTLKELGFRVYTNYVINAKYSSAYEYFKELLTRNDTIDLKNQDKRLTYIQILNSVVEDLRTSYELLEYEDMKFIKFSRLQMVYSDISKEMLEEYVDKAIEFASGKKYFTVKKLIHNGFSHRLDEVSLGEWFYSALIKNSRKVRFIKTGGSVIFYQGDRQITTTDFIRYLLEEKKKMDIYEFAKYINDKYGVILSKDKIAYLIKSTDMYYDSIMEKIYLTKEYYYDEV